MGLPLNRSSLYNQVLTTGTLTTRTLQLGVGASTELLVKDPSKELLLKDPEERSLVESAL